MSLLEVYDLVLKDGLRFYKYKNSQLRSISSADEEMRGSIFGYRSKKQMTMARGVVLTSLEAVDENRNIFTHWTPNVYRYGTYSDRKKRITRGHSEDNLRQINTFYIDFDITSSTENMTSGDILTTSLDLGFMPTLILKTDKGYQAYFVLEKAAYLTNKSQFKVLKVAKTISQNLRNYFAQTLPVDITCNHFGIARMPRPENIEFFNTDYVYSFDEWIQWSMKQSNLFEKKPNLTVLSGGEGKKQIDEPWFKLLLSESKIKGTKSLMGRNNVLFTLALAYYSSGTEQGVCEKHLSQFNQSLDEPLVDGEFEKIIKSAYSGKYEGASREHILSLCKTWVDKNLTAKELFIHQKWCKFKKKRADRKYSHLSEWKSDILAYLERLRGSEEIYLRMSKQALKEAIGIPIRSLDKVLSELKKEQKILYTVKKGRGGGVRLASVRGVWLYLIQLKKESQRAYLSFLAECFEQPISIIKQILSNTERFINGGTHQKQYILYEEDVG